jgi:hypothetical protein
LLASVTWKKRGFWLKFVDDSDDPAIGMPFRGVLRRSAALSQSGHGDHRRVPLGERADLLGALLGVLGLAAEVREYKAHQRVAAQPVELVWTDVGPPTGRKPRRTTRAGRR